jgi:hypothetical protein
MVQFPREIRTIQKNLDNVRKKVYAFRPRRSPRKIDRQAAEFFETVASHSGQKG